MGAARSRAQRAAAAAAALSAAEVAASEHLKGQYAREAADPPLPLLPPPLTGSTGSDPCYSRVELPRDPQGYVVSFAPDDVQGIRDFYNVHGVVVVRDCLTPDQCARHVCLRVWHGQLAPFPFLTQS